VSPLIYTVGHSNHSLTGFLDLLTLHNVTAIGDVRSQPVSTYTPHFSRDALRTELARANIAYVFLGDLLGGRSHNPDCYKNGRLQYARVALERCFDQGIARVHQGAARYRIALMCSEKDPLCCHRGLLVGRRLHQDGANVQHIQANGMLMSHAALETRLLTLCKLPEGDMFRDRKACIEDAYQIQGSRIAHADETMQNELARTA